MFDRRQALGLLGAGAGSPLLARAPGGSGRFLHGVASGDPSQDGAVLWTRVTPAAGAISGRIAVRWEVVEPASGRLVRRGTANATAARDFTVKVAVAGLRPGSDYAYRFTAPEGGESATGRFRTLPAGAVERLDFAVASCQLYQGGYFNAYAAIAGLERLDAVIHLGDYIYEYGSEYRVYGGGAPERVPDPPHETVTLADYRTRHAQAKADPDLQAAHARAAFICVWDDHEVANNSWTGGAENHQPEREGSWAARKAAALQAWFEWMPIREPVRPAPEAVFRAFAFGDLATLFMLETRLFARQQVPPRLLDAKTDADIVAGLAELRAPGRDLLGARQRQWLERGLRASVSAGQPWQLLGNQVIMAPVAVPDFAERFGTAGLAKILGGLDPALRESMIRRLHAARLGVPFNVDSWDGYPVAREELYRLFRRSGARPLVLSGDSHAFWANNLHGADGSLAARELGATAVSSPGYGNALPGLGLGKLLADHNPDVAFSDQDAKGFLTVSLTRSEARARFVAMATIKRRDSQGAAVAAFRASPAGPLERVEAAAAPA